MNVKSITLKDWAICGICGCKLFRIYNKAIARHIEIKCRQCKSINKIEIKDREIKNDRL